MERNHKRILISLIALLGLTGMYGAFHTTNAHADLANMQFLNERNRLRQDEFHLNADANKYHDEMVWANMESHEPHKTYNQELEDQERPLSEIYPNGHWNGMSDIKGDNTNYIKLKEKKDRAELRSLDKEISEGKAEEKADAKTKRKSNQWYSSHSHIGNNKIYYVGYKSFSRKKYHPAFIDSGGSYTKLGLSKNYKQVKRAVIKMTTGPSKSYTGYNKLAYKAVKILTPYDSFYAKIIRTINGTNIYRIKYNRHYYYFADYCDKYSASISPYTADYIKGSFSSLSKPWWHNIIVLNNRHKIHNRSKWDYEYGKGLMNDNNYKLYHNTWKDTGLGDNAPDWLD